jgi:mannose-1-phosphate guanylyltransferase/phosphomannomutase
VLDYAFGTTSFVMPNVLAKLGADVLVINPHVSTPGVLSYERHNHAERLAGLVRSSGAHLGAVFEPDGEQLTLVDDTGRILTDEEALCAMVALVAGERPGSPIVVPVDVPSEVTRLATAVSSEVVWTKLVPSDLMAACAQPGVGFGGNSQGGFIFPEFLPAFDAVSAFVHLLSLLAHSGSLLSEVVAGLKSPHVVRREVPTPFEHKGLVMRTLLERATADEVVLVDGVKLIDRHGWTLVVPDPEAPLTLVTAEGETEDRAEERAQQMAEQVGWIVAEATP